MTHDYLRRVYWWVAAAMMVAVVAGLAANAWFSHRTFERALVPEMMRKAVTVGTSVRGLMLKAVEHGIDFRRLHGVDEAFEEIRSENPDIAYLAVTDMQGRVLYHRFTAPAGIDRYFQSNRAGSGDASTMTRVADQYVTAIEIAGPVAPLGRLHIGIDSGFVGDIIVEMMFDVLVILVVALFFTLELLHFIAGARLGAGLQAIAGIVERGGSGDFVRVPGVAGAGDFRRLRRTLDAILERVNGSYLALARDLEAAQSGLVRISAAQLDEARLACASLREHFRFGSARGDGAVDRTTCERIRAPLFAFILAEELTRPFLPGYAHALLVPIPGISPDIVVGLPIVVFMLVVALGQPHIGAFVARHGQRKALMVGATIASLGLVGTSFAVTVIDLMLWRALCAVGYATVFVGAQAFVLDNTSMADRSKGFAIFVGSIMVATVCGPSIGGILADNVGPRVTLLVAAAIAALSILAIRMLPRDTPSTTEPPRPPQLADVGRLMLNGRFMTLTAVAAMPAKIVLTGICFYLVPLYMIAVGSSQAMAGRILMTYAVVMVIVAPIMATFARDRAAREWLVGGGLIVSGLGGVLFTFDGAIHTVFLAIFLVGIGQAMSITAQSALVGEHCSEEVARYGDHTVYGVYRLLERLGNAAGPLIAAGLLVLWGHRQGFIAIGALTVVCGVLFLLLSKRRTQPVPDLALR